MENNITIYQMHLSTSDAQKIEKIFGHNELIRLKKIENFQEVNAQLSKQTLHYLIVKDSPHIEKDIEFIIQNRGFFLQVNCLIITDQTNDKITSSLESLKEIFNYLDIINAEEKLIFFTAKISDLIEKHSKKANGPIYLPLDFRIFSAIQTAPCDLYIKLSDSKFIKIVIKNSKDELQEILKKYLSKNVKEFFIESNDLSRVKELIKKEIFTINPSDKKDEQKLKIAESVIAVARDFGVSDFLMEGINDTFQNISEDLEEDKKLEGLLKMINKQEGTILGNHSFLTAVFATLICSRTSWANSNVKKNMNLAALLHDLELTNSAHLDYEFKSLIEINKLDPKISDNFKDHGPHLAQILGKNSKIPGDTLNLIAKHHEGSKTSGYPSGVSALQLSPPNCLFNVAHQFSIELSKIAFNYTKTDTAFDRLKEHFSGSQAFKVYIEILENEFKIKK